MTVHFMCTCGTKTHSLPDSFTGKIVQCPTCKTLIIVPQPSDGGQIVIAMTAKDDDIMRNEGL